MTKKISVISALLVVCTWLASAAMTRYVFVNIGTYPGAALTFPQTLNARHIVGAYERVSPLYYHGYVQTGKKFRTLEPPNVISSFLEGINDHDVMVGGYCDTNPSCNALSSQHGFAYSKGVFTTLDYPSPGYTLAASGINNRGQIVGGFCLAPLCPASSLLPSNNAFLWSNGVFTTINFPGAELTQAYAINDLGQVVGAYLLNNNSPLLCFLYQSGSSTKGSFTSFAFPNARYTFALGINNSGVISGIYGDQQSVTHGFIYNKGVFTRVDVPHASASGLSGIDNRGDVIANANINGVIMNYKGIRRASEGVDPPNGPDSVPASH